MTEEPKDPKAAGDKPASDTPAEPLKGEVSRTDSPGAGVSAAPTAVPALGAEAAQEPKATPPAPKPDNPAAATATTSETSSATGQGTAAPSPEAAAPAA